MVEVVVVMVEGSLMASTAGVVLLACGSFNPINNMHLRMFGECCWSIRDCLLAFLGLPRRIDIATLRSLNCVQLRI